MMKHLLIISAAAISVPAFAQTAPAADPASPPPTEQPDPSTSQPTPAPAPDNSGTTQPAPADNATTQPAPSGTAATPAQIAQIVNTEFPTYDADKNGDLNQAEFAAWMKKLRTATEPSVDPESEQVKTWIGQAWTAADADKSGAVSKDELTAFLSRGA